MYFWRFGRYVEDGMAIQNPLLGKKELYMRQSFDRREVDLSTRYGIEEIGVGLFVGGGEPAVRGSEDVPGMEGRRFRERDPVELAGGEAVQRGGSGVAVLGGVEEEGSLVRGGAEAEPPDRRVLRVPGAADGARD